MSRWKVLDEFKLIEAPPNSCRITFSFPFFPLCFLFSLAPPRSGQADRELCGAAIPVGKAEQLQTMDPLLLGKGAGGEETEPHKRIRGKGRRRRRRRSKGGLSRNPWRGAGSKLGAPTAGPGSSSSSSAG